MATGFNEPLLRAIKGETNLLLLSIVTGQSASSTCPKGADVRSGKVSCRAYAPPPNKPRRSGPKLSRPACSSASGRTEYELEDISCASSCRLIWRCKADSSLGNQELTWISPNCQQFPIGMDRSSRMPRR